MNLLDKLKSFLPRRPPLGEEAPPQNTDRYSRYPSVGLTPIRLAEIFKAADGGDVLLQMELFEEMEEKDPHLFSQLQTRKNAVTGLDYEIIPASDTPLDMEIAEFVREQLEGLENLEDIMLDLLDAIGKGIAISEIIWRIHGGRMTVDDIRARHQKRLLWDYEDQLRITTDQQPTGMLIPENKFIIHRYKARSGHPARAGVLRVVTWMYLFKNYDVKDWVSFCEVFGMPTRVGTYNPSASEADKAALMQALISLGTDAAGIIPEGTNIEFKEAAKISSINLYESLARYCDEQVSKAVLGQTLTSDTGNNGSYAQSKTHNEVRHDLTLADCKALAATLRRDLISPLVRYNYGFSVSVPKLQFDCEEADDLKQTAEIYKTLITEIGLPIGEAHLYKKFSIPEPSAGDKLITPAATGGSPQPLPFKASGGEMLVLKTGTGSAQPEIDQLTAAAIGAGGGTFDKMFTPVRELLKDADSLEQVREQLEDEAFVEKLYSAMDVSDLEQLLQRAMFLADMTGRGLEE